MITRSTLILFVLLNAATGKPPGQVFRSTVDVVTVPVSITRDGVPVTGLTESDFRLFEGGKPQTIDAVSIEASDLDVILVLDSSSSVEGHDFTRLKAGVNSAASVLRPSDRFRLITARQPVRDAGIGFQELGEWLARAKATGSTSLYDAVVATSIVPESSTHRRVVLIFTDGRDTSSIHGAAEALAVARHSHSIVHFVVPTDGPATPIYRSVPARAKDATNETLEAIAAVTGGRVWPLRFGDSFGEAVQRVLERTRYSYLLRYRPAPDGPEGWREITVQLNRRGNFIVLARRGYMAPARK